MTNVGCETKNLGTQQNLTHKFMLPSLSILSRTHLAQGRTHQHIDAKLISLEHEKDPVVLYLSAVVEQAVGKSST
jgi:hypothetical protein